jgi:hypothetical protein
LHQIKFELYNTLQYDRKLSRNDRVPQGHSLPVWLSVFS